MEEFYVLDTCSFYSYCCKYLNLFTDKDISPDDNSLKMLHNAFNASEIKIIIPSVIMVEIFDHYFNDEEFINKFKYEVYYRLFNTDNECNKIAIIDIDTEVLENLFNCYTENVNVDLHDKLILATALKYKEQNTTLFTSDRRIKKIQRLNHLSINIRS